MVRRSPIIGSLHASVTAAMAAEQQEGRRLIPSAMCPRPLRSLSSRARLMLWLLALLLGCFPEVVQCQCIISPAMMAHVNTTVGSSTTCVAGGSLTAGSACVVECLPPAIMQGSDRFMCEPTGGRFWSTQSGCALWQPVPLTISQVSITMGAGQAQPVAFSRSPAAAASQVARHAATGQSSAYTGWIAGVLLANATHTSLWVSRDGTAWIPRIVPSTPAHSAGAIPGIVIDGRGRITLLYACSQMSMSLATLSLSDDFTSWSQLADGPATISPNARYLWTSTPMLGDPNRLLFGAGALGAPAISEMNDVWLYTGSENADGSGSLGTFTLQTASAPWSARRSPCFFMLPPRSDGVTTTPRLVVGYGFGFNASSIPIYTQHSDLWISEDLGVSWQAYSPAASSAAALRVYPLGNTITVSAASWGPNNVAIVLATGSPRRFAASFDGRQATSLVLESNPGGWEAMLNPSAVNFQSFFFWSFGAGAFELFAYDPTSLQMGRSVIMQSAVSGVTIRDAAGNELELSVSFDPSVHDYTLMLQQDTAAFSVQAHVHYGEAFASCDTGSTAFSLLSDVWSNAVECGASENLSVLTLVTAESVYRFALSLRQVTSMDFAQGQAALAPPHWLSTSFEWLRFAYDVMPSPAFASADAESGTSNTANSNSTAWGELTLYSGLAFGALNFSIDGVAQSPIHANAGSAPLSIHITLPPTPDPLHPPLSYNLSFSTSSRTYTFIVHNPCGFLVGSVNGLPSALPIGFSSAGTRCPPRSACLPRAFTGWLCSPLLLAATTRAVNDTTGEEDDPVVLAGGAFTLAYIHPITALNPYSSGQRFRVSYLVVASEPAFEDPSSFVSVLSFSSAFAPSPNGVGSAGVCGPVTLGVSSSSSLFPGPYLQTFLQNGVVGSGMQFQLRTCMIEPFQCVTTNGADYFSSAPPRFTPHQLTRPAAPVGSTAETGDLVAASMNEALVFSETSGMPSAQTLVVFGPRATLQQIIDVAFAANPMGYITYSDFQSNVTFLRGSVSSRMDPTDGMFSCFVSIVHPSFEFELTCTTPTGPMLNRQRMPFLAWSGGALALSDDTISYPVRPTVSRVRSALCRDYPLPTDEIADLQVLLANGTIACPAAGGVSVEISGSGFAAADVVVNVAGRSCVNVSISSPTMLSCTLSAGTGRAASVVVQSYGQLSEPAPLLSYAGPTIMNISSSICRTRNLLGDIVMLSDCLRDSVGGDGRMLTLTGVNFGVNTATVFVGSSRCVKPSPRNSNDRFICIMPTGKNLLQNVMLIQDGGSFSTQAHSISYEQCPQGTFDPTPYLDGLACSPCAPGTFNDAPGSTGCAPCPAGLWLQTSPGATPSSANCRPCLEGGQCGAQLISSAEGHWLAMEQGSGSLKAYACPTQLCVACDESSIAAQLATLSSVSGGGANLTSSSFFTCCSANRDPSSPLCGECLSGYESWGNECKHCVESDGSMVFLFLLLSTLLVAWLAHSASNASVGLTSIALYFLQTTSLELGQSAVLLGWVRALNFDPDFLTSGSSSCPLKLSVYGQTVLAIMMPFILSGELAVIAVIHALTKRFMDPAEVAAAARNDSAFFSLARWASRCSLRYYICALVSIWLFTYTSVSSAVIESLWCVPVGSSRVVFSMPSMDCDSARYKQLLPLVIVALVTFTIGFPLIVLAGGFWRHRSRARHSSVGRQESAVVSVSSLIPLYGVFRTDCWYWSFAVLARRTIFVLLDVSLAAQPRLRNAAFTFANLIAYAMSLYAAPFPTAMLNRVEAASHFSLIVLSLLITAQLPSYNAAVNRLLLVAVLLTLLLFVCMAIMQRRMALHAKRNRHGDDEPTVQLAEVHATMHSDSAAVAPASPYGRHAGSQRFDSEETNDSELQANPAAAAAAASSSAVSRLQPRSSDDHQQVEL